MNVYTLQVFRDGAPLVAVEIDDKTIYSKILMGDYILQCSVTLTSPLPLLIGDYVVYKNNTYTLNKGTSPAADDVSLTYDFVFEPCVYTLYDKKFKHLGAKTFTYFGNLVAHLNLLIENINSLDTGWTIAFAEDTEEIYISYDKDNCRTALTKITDAFKFEYDVDEKSITVRKTIGKNTELSFEIGPKKGLYTLKPQSVDDSAVVTRAFGYGGTKNIDYKYRDGAKQLVFSGEFLEKNVNLYPHAKEEDYDNEEIYPQRTGSATGISTNLDTKVYTITDTTIDFDLNSYMQEGTPAKLVFKSGELSGSQFEIQKYNHSTKTITYKELKDTNDYALPNTTYQAAVGDKYTLIDINMPQSYIDVAEAKLRAETQDYLDQNSIPRVIYQLDIDEKYVRDNNIQLSAGDYINIKDDRLGINGKLRISAINWPLVNEAAIQCTISNFILDSSANRVISAVKNAQVAIKNNYNGNILESRRQTSNLASLRDSVFDPTGNYYTEKIKPGSVETLYLAVGAKANDFNLSEVVIKANVNGNASQIEITSGRLLHNSIQITAGFVWIMSGATMTGLISNTRYYVYAKCSKESLVGTFVVSATQIKLEDVAGYYHFNMGVLFPVNADGYRDFEFTKGMAYLVGDTLTAGKIKSIDAQTYWDLTNGKFKLGNSTTGLDWNDTTPNTLTIRGAIVQSPSGVTAPIGIFRGVYSSSNTYFKGESVTYNGSTWTFINNTPSGATPAEGTNWTEAAKKGSDGTSISLKGSVASEANLPTTGNSVGDGYITDDTGHLWMWNGSSWGDLGEIRGPQGDPGQPGAPGSNGSPGIPGANGLTPYLHIKYSNDGGLTFTGNGGEDPGDFRGEYVDYTQADSSSVGAYTWVKIKGDQGIQGPVGANGQTLYTWIKYADNVSGGGMSTNPSGKSYIGIAYNKTSPTMSNTAGDYTWSLYQGPQGVQGSVGPDGQPTYTWIKYADDASGSGLSDNPTGKIYLGIAYNKNTPTESLSPGDYSFSLIKGDQGITPRILYSKNSSADVAPTLTQTANPSGWSEIAPATDDNIYLADNSGNIIADINGNYIGVGISAEYLWQINEKITTTGAFVSWSPANRVTGRKAPLANFVEVRFAKSGSPTVPPALNINDSDPNGWTTQAPSFGTLEYLWKIYGEKYGETKQLKGSWNGPYRETALDGSNGTSSYFHIAYAANNTGTVGFNFTGVGDYIGTYSDSNPTNSTNPALYTWTLVKGQQGGQGIPGATGANGQTSYLHIKYSNDGGTTFTGNSGEDVGDYMGTYVDFNAPDSTSVGSYTWARIKGNQGIQGTQGISGTSSYFHVRYSPNANGSGMGTSTNTYIGTVVTNSPTAPTDYTLYTWVRLIGAQGADGNQGIPGTNGANGATSYLHIKYSNDGGVTFTSNGGEDPGAYIGQYVDFTEADSNVVGSYTWSLIKGDKGDQGIPGTTGPTGAQGPVGPLPTGGDIYDPAKTYTGTSTNVSIVRYNDGTGEKAYVARVDAGTFSGIIPTNTSKWNAFGGQYESVATKLFFASLAYIENLGVRYLATDTSGHKRVEINGIENNIRVLSAADKILIEADDDSALEGFTIQPNDPPLPPTIVPIYGPGFRVGTLNDPDGFGFSSAGRKGFITSGFFRKLNQSTNAIQFDLDATTGKVLANSGIDASTLKIINSLTVMDGDSEKTGWTGKVTLRLQSNVWINRTVSSSPLTDGWITYTYKNGIIVNVENSAF